jgi:succinate-semialdehyde dehydrogenase/glutarate-semialdehyde dehydrogenase
MRVYESIYLDGDWADADASERIEVRNPATERVIAAVPAAGPADVDAAVEAAQAAADEWAATPPERRAEHLAALRDALAARRDDAVATVVKELGAPVTLAERVHVGLPLTVLDSYVKLLAGYEFEERIGTSRVFAEPVGVVGAITPWNYPLHQAVAKVAAALAAGCPVVLKPAEDTPLTALALAALLEEAGVPAGVVNVVPTSRPGPVTAAMMADPRVRKLSFTGSTEVGRQLLRQGADTVLSCSMELGGNAPFIVFDDADLDAAIEGALIAKLRNGGEACTAANRFYVHEAVAAEFTARLADRFGKLTLGPGLEESTDIGPLVNEATRSKVASLVDGVEGDGGQIVLGGSAPDRRGFYYQPTVIDQVPASAAIAGTEIFGPVAPVIRFSSEEEAVAWANDVEYGLVSYVYSRDLRRGLRVSEALETGMVGLNRGIVSDPAAPFGGVKQSGLGREGGHDGLLEYLETKYIATDW